jgi:Uma2 family endonuclease
MSSTLERPSEIRLPLTLQEYLDREDQRSTKHHFYFGEEIEMPGSSLDHNTIAGNIVFLLQSDLQETDCRVLPGDMKVQISSGVVFYPDVVVTCGAPLVGLGAVPQNPQVVVEVLSQRTEAFDRGRKFQQYRSVSTLRHLLFVEQDRPFVEHFVQDEHGWRLAGEYSDLEATLNLVIGETTVTLPLRRVYRLVNFPSSADASTPNA